MRHALCLLVPAVALLTAGCAGPSWSTRLEHTMPLLGHRNWLVIADAAYPLQSSPGITTRHVGGGHIEAVRTALRTVQRSPNLRPKVYLDTELGHVPEKHAPGIERFRSRLKELTDGMPVVRKPHAELLKKLKAEAAKYRVVVLKTDGEIPYGTVFIRLNAGYWSPEAERAVRQSIKRASESE